MWTLYDSSVYVSSVSRYRASTPRRRRRSTLTPISPHSLLSMKTFVESNEPCTRNDHRYPPTAGEQTSRGRQKLRFSTNIWLHRVLLTVLPPTVTHTAAPDRGKLMTLIAGKRRRLLLTGNGRRSVYDKFRRYADDKRTELNIIRKGESEG